MSTTVTRTTWRAAGWAVLLTGASLVVGATEAQGQKPSRGGGVEAVVDLPTTAVAVIREYYDRHTVSAEALPPGIRRRLARGKALPPGIAKKAAPGELQARVDLPGGYELVEVGLDVLLVEAATGIVHDVLMDVIR
ncbi:MAG: anti-virulence regulator CigR family protein [Longimicrobiales bacterium]|nr:anti-virulence regulator CigR family protein [Longimicrobiales bacterium]